MSIEINSSALASLAPSSLSGESDHRIANSLAVIASLVRLRATRSDAADARAFLVEIANRIDTVGKLHRLLAQSRTGAVELDKYMQEVCECLSGALAPEATALSIDCSCGRTIPSHVALPLGLITAELFSNSLKYAHPAGLPIKVTVSCTAEAAGLTLIYEDDGVGFPERFDLTYHAHMGIHFIHTLSEQLGGAPKWLSDPLGIRFELVIPNAVLEPPL
jgi:two-component sensor histidine kinase